MKTICKLLYAAAAISAAVLVTFCTSNAPKMSPKLDEATLDDLIEDGQFNKANKILSEALMCDSLSEADRYLINFEKDKMQRILADFNKNEAEVLEYIKKLQDKDKEED